LRRRPSTTNDAFSVTIVVTRVVSCKTMHGRRPTGLKGWSQNSVTTVCK